MAFVSFLLCTRIPWPRGRLQRLEIHKTQIWAVLQLIADMGSAGQAAMSSAKVRICMCVCVLGPMAGVFPLQGKISLNCTRAESFCWGAARGQHWKNFLGARSRS